MAAISKSTLDSLFSREKEVNNFQREMSILLKVEMSQGELRKLFDSLPHPIQVIGVEWGLLNAGFLKDVVAYWERYGH